MSTIVYILFINTGNYYCHPEKRREAICFFGKTKASALCSYNINVVELLDDFPVALPNV